jgi:hypothetical protein
MEKNVYTNACWYLSSFKPVHTDLASLYIFVQFVKASMSTIRERLARKLEVEKGCIPLRDLC